MGDDWVTTVVTLGDHWGNIGLLLENHWDNLEQMSSEMGRMYKHGNWKFLVLKK